jgi:hypothetical protein
MGKLRCGNAGSLSAVVLVVQTGYTQPPACGYNLFGACPFGEPSNLGLRPWVSSGYRQYGYCSWPAIQLGATSKLLAFHGDHQLHDHYTESFL